MNVISAVIVSDPGIWDHVLTARYKTWRQSLDAAVSPLHVVPAVRILLNHFIAQPPHSLFYTNYFPSLIMKNSASIVLLSLFASASLAAPTGNMRVRQESDCENRVINVRLDAARWFQPLNMFFFLFSLTTPSSMNWIPTDSPKFQMVFRGSIGQTFPSPAVRGMLASPSLLRQRSNLPVLVSPWLKVCFHVRLHIPFSDHSICRPSRRSLDWSTITRDDTLCRIQPRK